MSAKLTPVPTTCQLESFPVAFIEIPVDLEIICVQGQFYCNSLQLASKFNKNHQHILRDVRNLSCYKKFSRSNFGWRDYVDVRGKTQEIVWITEKGCMYLIMGFTGESAAKWKEKFIEAFDALRSVIIPKLLQENAELKATNAKLLPKQKKEFIPSPCQILKNSGISTDSSWGLAEARRTVQNYYRNNHSEKALRDRKEHYDKAALCDYLMGEID